MEPFFEQHSWLLIVAIIVLVEGCRAMKALVSRLIRQDWNRMRQIHG